jgi:glycosyltransferase involved in cell wall biosynthesis
VPHSNPKETRLGSTDALHSPARRSAERRRILVCTPYPPRLDARHGGKATSQLLLRLAERNDVALLCLRKPDEQPVDPAIAKHCNEVVEVPLSTGGSASRRLSWLVGLTRNLPPWAADCRSARYASELARLLDSWRPEVVEIHLQAMAQYVDVPVRKNVRAILVDYDPGSAWVDDLRGVTTGPRRLALRLEAAAWRRYERATRPRFGAIVAFAERDLVAIGSSAGNARLVRIPLAVDVPPRPLDPMGSGPPTILFVGSFSHPPNVDAATWLAERLFPRVRERVPDARLDIVGQDPTDEIRALASDAVSVHASVPDVTPFADRAAVVVTPIRLGGSMRMKVLEALAAGKALVATPRAAEGVEATAGKHFLLAAGDDELVDAIAKLLLDPERRSALGHAAREWAERHLGWDRGIEAFERLYDTLADGRSAAEGTPPAGLESRAG